MHAPGMRSLALLVCLASSLAPACVADEADLGTAELEATDAPSPEDMEAIQAAEDAAGDEAVLSPGCDCTYAGHDPECPEYAYVAAGFGCERAGVDESQDSSYFLRQTHIDARPGADSSGFDCLVPLAYTVSPQGYRPSDIGSVFVLVQYNVPGQQVSCTLRSKNPSLSGATSHGSCTVSPGSGVQSCALTQIEPDANRISDSHPMIWVHCSVPAPGTGQAAALMAYRVCYDII